MKIKSIVQSSQERLEIIEIEMSLIPGLPILQLVGMPDQHLKESTHRIKCAIKAAGYEWPEARQIVVNLRPSNIRKQSQGLDLAIALCYLWVSGQAAVPEGINHLVVYGQLSLDGQVMAPDDLNRLQLPQDLTLLTGVKKENEKRFLPSFGIDHLDSCGDWAMQEVDNYLEYLMRPEWDPYKLLTKTQATIIEILAVGGHSALLAGSSGGGKSFLAKALKYFCQTPNFWEFLEIQRSHDQLNWRPFIEAHHTTPVISMVGGGSSVRQGEISKAHLGFLVLDELLEFNPYVVEALREPFEQKSIRVSRAGKSEVFAADCQIIATTNLCPCGDWLPGKTKLRCRYSLSRCKSYMQKLSGPLVDRFETLFFTDKLEAPQVSADELMKRLQQAWIFQEQQGRLPGKQQLTVVDLLKQAGPVVRLDCAQQKWGSMRRELATLRVARTLADLEGHQKIEVSHYQAALEIGFKPFLSLKSFS